MGLLTSFLNLFNAVHKLLFYGWPFLLIIYIVSMRIKWRKWPLEAVIFEKRGDNLVKTNDRIKKEFDRYTNISSYRLEKSKDTIPICNYDWILHNKIVPNNLIEKFINLVRGTEGVVFLFRYGTKQYKPIKISMNKDAKIKLKEIKDKEGNPIFIWQYEQFDPRDILGKLDFEVVDWDNMNFMVQEQRASVVRRQKRGEFWKQTLIPIVIIAACVLIGIFILKFSADAGNSLRTSSAPAAGDGSGSKVLGAIQGAFTPGG